MSGYKLMTSILALALSAGTMACGEATSGSNNGTSANNGEGGDTAQVEGRMSESDSPSGEALGGDVSTYAVTAYKVQSDGSLEAVSTGEAEVGADGQFSVEVDTSAGAVSDVILEAKNDAGSTGRVIVSETLETGDSVRSAPIDAETSVEADVYVEARSQGSWNADSHHTSQLRAMIDAKTAADVRASSDYESDVETTAKATVAAIEAWSRALLSSEIGATQSDVDAAVEATATAQSELDAKLYEASSDSEAQTAMQAYADAAAQAYVDAGITAQQRAEASHAAAEAMLTYAGELSADASAQAKARAETFRAAHVRAAIESHLEAMSSVADEQKQNVVAAGETLRSELHAAAEAEGEVDAQIAAAWSDYRASVEQAIAASVTAQAALTALAADIESSLDSFQQAVGSLSADAEASAAAQAAVSAVTDAHAQIITEANVETLTTAGVEAADAEMIVRVYFNLATAS